MRIGAFRALAHHARRAARAVSVKMRDLGLDIGRGVGVGGDESSFGGGRSRVWLETWVEEARERVLGWLERSSFERFPRFRRALRRLLGTRRTLPPAEAPAPRPKGPSGPLGARPLGGEVDPRVREELRARQIEAHTREGAGLRDQIESSRRRPTPRRSS